LRGVSRSHSRLNDHNRRAEPEVKEWNSLSVYVKRDIAKKAEKLEAYFPKNGRNP